MSKLDRETTPPPFYQKLSFREPSDLLQIIQLVNDRISLDPGLCDSKCLSLSYIALLFSDNVVFKLSCDAWKGTFQDGLRGKEPCKPRAQNIYEQDPGVMG